MQVHMNNSLLSKGKTFSVIENFFLTCLDYGLSSCSFFFGKMSWEWEIVCQGKQGSFSHLWLSHKGIPLRESYLFMGTKLREQLCAVACIQSCCCGCEIGLREPHASCHYKHKSYTFRKKEVNKMNTFKLMFEAWDHFRENESQQEGSKEK